MTDMSAVAEPSSGPRRASLLVVVTIVLLAFAMLVWANVSTLEIWASGPGKVIPSSQIQVVQNLEGGIVREVFVREGDLVHLGQPVARIEAIEAQSKYQEYLVTWQGLSALVARLQAEANGTPLVFPADLQDGSAGAANAIAAERAAYAARSQELNSTLSVYDRQRTDQLQSAEDASVQDEKLSQIDALVAKQIDMLKPQVAKGLVSETELLKAQRELADTALKRADLQAAINAATRKAHEIEAQMQATRAKFVAEANGNLSEKKTALAGMAERVIASKDQVTRSLITAPVEGIVKQVKVTTPGEVVKPGDTIAEFVPTRDDLLIEVHVSPKDIGFIRTGQESTVRLTAYDSSIYGSLPAVVERVGADTLVTRDGDSYYSVVVRITNAAAANGQELDIIPGMMAVVNITTGHRTIFDYIFKPLTKIGSTAFRER
ncbi:HlyD family type I secretion periplasmic adaptor subunit [Rhizobium sp. SL86]|uniref:HlyD family type I secretion periplasmic adaptor subunit n=1 Tax=Rhizobium sp. SL86 TaxID=2995148 RepID=UPI002276AA22|nr:HlyD family type I secretion periplasmic adaptor subunit [Rhizobium sp. SL86]MCY1668976.1 HlyD family type I secretion periplasmic adaptor subunit [Rhizobium sp. SL86]